MQMLSFSKNVEIICYDTFLNFFLIKESGDKWTIQNDTKIIPKNPLHISLKFCYYIKCSLESLQKYCETIKIKDSKMIVNVQKGTNHYLG
jgi:hypothetical protein